MIGNLLKIHVVTSSGSAIVEPTINLSVRNLRANVSDDDNGEDLYCAIDYRLHYTLYTLNKNSGALKRSMKELVKS